jgi:hypothetical protein
MGMCDPDDDNMRLGSLQDASRPLNETPSPALVTGRGMAFVLLRR